MKKLQMGLVLAGLLAGGLAIGACGDDGDSLGSAEQASVSLSNSRSVSLSLPATSSQMKAQREVIFKNSGNIDLEVKNIEWVARPDQLVLVPNYVEDTRCTYDAGAAPTYDSSGACPSDSVCWALNGECRQTGVPELPFSLGKDKTYAIKTILLPGSDSLRCPEQPADAEPISGYCGELRVTTNANTNDGSDIVDGSFNIVFTHTQGAGTLEVSPQTLNFNGVGPGESASRDITLSNVHPSESLTVSHMRVRDQETYFDVARSPSLPAEIGSGSDESWTITFQPPSNWDGENFGTNLEIETSANPGKMVLVPIDVKANPPLPSIQVEPAVLEFSSQTTQTLTISNDGGANLMVTGFSPDPAGYYSVEPTGSTVVVRPGESKEFEVTFEYPTDTEPGGVGTLGIQYNYNVGDQVQSDTYTVTLLGNIGDAPLGMISPQALDFHAAAGVNATRSFVLRNLGSEPLEIADAEITQTTGSADAFSTTLSTPLTIAPGEMSAFDVTYTSSDDENDRGAIRLTSNTTGNDLFVSLIADPGEASGASAEITPEFGDDAVGVGESAAFNAQDSDGYDESALRLGHWVLLKRPAGSQAFLDKIGATAAFIPDVAGEYTVSLLLGEGDGPNADQATYSFTAN